MFSHMLCCVVCSQPEWFDITSCSITSRVALSKQKLSLVGQCPKMKLQWGKYITCAMRG